MALAQQKIVVLATSCAALVVTAQVGGKALRDALFLSVFPVTDLPGMVMIAAVLSISGALGMTRLLSRWGPRLVTSMFFVGSAALLCLQGVLSARWPEAIAFALYLHMAVFGALLMSGFWSAVSESFDPSAARKHIGTVAGGATAGGLLGGVLAERVAAWSEPTTMFFILTGVHLLCAAACASLTPLEEATSDEPRPDLRESLKQIMGESYLVKLALLVVLATMTENIFDYLLKAEAAAAMDRASLMRFFGVFYTVVGLVTFLLQLVLSKRFLERFGPAKATGTLPVIAGAGAIALLAAPGLIVAVVARGGFSVGRNSLFRSGYELFFAPLSAARKRSAKTLIDVGSDRMGDLLGGLAITAVLFLLPAHSTWLMCGIALVLAVTLLAIARELQRGYVNTLEAQLIDRGGELVLTQSIMQSGFLMQTLAGFGAPGLLSAPTQTGSDAQTPMESVPLHERDAVAVEEALSGPLDVELAQQAIELLAREDVARVAGEALTRNAFLYLDLLAAELLNSQADFAVRRRIPRIIAKLPAAKTSAPLLAGLSDRRFEVRFQCAAALYHYALKKQGGEIDTARIYEVIEHDVAVSKRLWNTRHVLDASPDEDSDLIDRFLGDRVDRSLQHIFHLLGLIHPTKPLRVAFQGLHVDDVMLRGTALEYLLTILPPSIYGRLMQVMGEDVGKKSSDQHRGRALASLMASQASIEIEVEALRALQATAQEQEQEQPDSE